MKGTYDIILKDPTKTRSLDLKLDFKPVIKEAIMDAEMQAKLAALGMTPGNSSSTSESAGSSDHEESAPIDMDALLSQSLADIPDLADYVNPKNGAYGFHVDSVETDKMIGESKVIQLSYTINQVVQVDNDAIGDTVKVGDKYSELYFISTPKGAAFNLGRLKKLLAPVAEKFGTTTLRDTLAAFAGCDVAGVIKNKKDKQDSSIVRSSLIKIVFTN